MARGGHDEQAWLRADLDILKELLCIAEEENDRTLAEAIRRVGRQRNDRLTELRAQRPSYFAPSEAGTDE